MIAKRKPKKCRICPEKFVPCRMGQFACSVKCAIEWSNRQSEKKKKAQHRADKERIKTRGAWLNDCKNACNAYVRERDHDQPCISCDKPPSPQIYGGQWDAGHYRSVGSAPHIRFVLNNIHKQCVYCNRDLDGNIVAYRPRLIERIGLATVEAIEADQAPRKYSIEEIRAMTANFRKLTRELKKRREYDTA